MLGGRDSHVEDKGRRGPAPLLAMGVDGHAVCHAGDRIGFYEIVAIRATPGAIGVAIDCALECRSHGQSVNVRPLLDGLLGICGLYRVVAGAMPDRDLGPGPLVRGCGPHQVAPFPRRAVAALKYALEPFLKAIRATVWQSGDDGAAGEHLRISR